MRKRRLGWTDLELTAVGLGTWAIGGGGWQYAWGPQDDRESRAAILAALEAGVNWIDTAPGYGLGHSEEVVGAAVREFGGPVVLATKCSRLWNEKGELYGSLKAASIRKEAEDSLRRLGAGRIDLYQVHWPEPAGDIEEAWTAIAGLVGEGKVRYGGVSNYSVAQMERIRGIHRIASLQPPYNMLRRQAEAGLLPYCARNEIGVVAYSPMGKGLLTGRITPERVAGFAADDHRRHDPAFNPPQLEVNLKLAGGLAALAEKSGHTAAQLAVAWTLRRPEVTAAIVGARRPEQIAETAAAGDWELGKEEIAGVERLLEERERALEG